MDEEQDDESLGEFEKLSVILVFVYHELSG
jgi:hypothetical protein